ncbi:MAG: DNA-protecting protein DprA [Sediminimonas qiaohouensis]|uniref:DNA-protecting protein DprA n=1 Tax=Sediminimonas qiaohouensis TaxID=552061 RepID=A0A7C9HA83_9RHOB|nr:DNA-processing protein DprA [Sediminimonas qiaohouensis]MTJ03265.1 DNA-protecting protein DprA [Sediminimonas qiaohouensis]
MTEEHNPSSTHPLLPPTTEDDRVSWLRLLRSRRVGPSTFYRLMSEHGNAQTALAALPGIAQAAGVASYAPCPEDTAIAEMRAAQTAGARMICFGETEYPATLAEIGDAPPLLWAIGDMSILQRPMIALVGARNASSLGTRMARALAVELGQAGYVVVSGLARGVDTAAHAAALDSGTLAVLAGGVDVLYPSENARLANDITAHGLRLSEQPMGMTPQARHFPRRNRIISGLCPAIVVVEAAAKSGSLITARSALDQGREVLAVPGHPFDARAAGCNMLIRDGAALVRNARDVISVLAPIEASQPQLDLGTPQPPETPKAPKRTLRETAALHGEILQRLGPSPLAEDQLIRDLNAPARVIAPALVDLELDGKIRRSAGGLLALG